MSHRIGSISFAIAMPFVSAGVIFPAQADIPDRLIKIQETQFAASVEGHAVASTRAAALGVLVRGIRAARLAQLLGESSASPSEWRVSFEKGEAVAVGSALAKQLSLGVGDTITLAAPHDPRAASNAPRIKTYKIDVILPHDLAVFDAVLVLMAVSEAQSYSDR